MSAKARCEPCRSVEPSAGAYCEWIYAVLRLPPDRTLWGTGCEEARALPWIGCGTGYALKMRNAYAAFRHKILQCYDGALERTLLGHHVGSGYNFLGKGLTRRCDGIDGHHFNSYAQTSDWRQLCKLKRMT